MTIRTLEYNEIGLLKDFPPKDWNFDIGAFMRFHWEKRYFYAIVAELNGKIAGVGNIVLNNNAGWLGNIIVDNNFRSLGIGKALTKHLVGYLTKAGCKSQLLIATEMGKPIVTTSANIVGQIFMTNVDNLNPDIKCKMGFILYEGEKKGKPSSIVDLTAGEGEIIVR